DKEYRAALRGDTPQDKHVKEAKSRCRTIASLLTDAPNPHSKGVLMFKKRRQRSKKYTLTSFGSVDEDNCRDSQEEDGVFPGSESEFDEDGFSSVPDPTWDSDYLDTLEKRATAGTEGRGDWAEEAPSPGLSDTTGKGAQLFEQQRKRAAEHAKKVETAQPQAPPQSQVQDTASMVIPAPPAETPLPELPASNVLNRTARPFTPGFISIRAATAPVTFRPTVTKTNQRPASAAVMPPPFSTASELSSNATSFASQIPPVPPSVFSKPSSVPQANIVAPVPQPQIPPPLQFSTAPTATVSVVSQPEAVAQTPVPGQTGKTGILLEARRRAGKPKPMFNVPEVTKKSPNPELLCMVQNLDDRSTLHKYGQPQSENIYDDVEEDRSGEASMGRAPPPVAPKPRVIHDAPQFLQAGGKGAQLFARRQNRMGMYVVEAPSETPYQQELAMRGVGQPLDSSSNAFMPSQWKYSPNVRAPPPIGYNPLLAPSIPTGPQRDTTKPDGRGIGGSQREGIKALDFMRRQPYQLNSAMFNYGGSIPIKTARVFEVKRFSTPTPMSAPTLNPKVIAPRSATTLGERLTYSGMTSPPSSDPTSTPAPFLPTARLNAPTPVSPPSHLAARPSLPKFSNPPIPNPVPPAVPKPYTPVSYTSGLQTAKQFQSAPELSILASLPPLRSDPVQAPKPRFVATKGGVQPHVWRPGAL
uniref:Synaptopodin 2-like a n=1 Tax=Labrus bergylta TaxID=56723 RepID=A0A3Q3G4U8_9LABR